ncbi:MAG: DUF4281 domain-containing protein [Anaerolineae bacterium]|nr:DUF4281 domain-containing protein [Anaerolineae bacterium]
MLDTLFLLTFIIPAPFWFFLIFLPNRQITRRLFATSYSHIGFLALGALYLFVLVGGVVGGVSASTFAADKLTSLSGLTSLATNQAFVLTLWLHLVTMDLAGGFFIYRSAQDMHMGGFTIGVIEFFTLLLGPVGMLMFALMRVLYGMRKRMEAAKLEQ